MDVRRRLATNQELEQGQEEMRRSDARMKREAIERGEEALEDRTSVEAEVKVEGRDEPEKGTPAKTPSQSSASKQLLPPMHPPPDPPVLGNDGSPSHVDVKKMTIEKGNNMLGSLEKPIAMESATPGGQSDGVVGATEFARAMAGPLHCFRARPHGCMAPHNQFSIHQSIVQHLWNKMHQGLCRVRWKGR